MNFHEKMRQIAINIVYPQSQGSLGERKGETEVGSYRHVLVPGTEGKHFSGFLLVFLAS